MRHALALTLVLLAVALVLGIPTRATVYANDPTLDAAEQIIRQATRAAQSTRDAQTRIAGDATRAYAQTRAALDAYATRQAIDAQATRAAIEAHATATAERQRYDATATRIAEEVARERVVATLTAVWVETRAAQERAAVHATMTMYAISAQATREAIQRAAEDEARYTATAQVAVIVILVCLVAFVAVAIRALLHTPRPVVIETTKDEGRTTNDEGLPRAKAKGRTTGVSSDIPIQTDLPKTKVVFDPEAVKRITEILEFQERDDDHPSVDPEKRA